MSFSHGNKENVMPDLDLCQAEELYGQNKLLVPPLKWHGGKHYLADAIIKHMPRHMTYVEPYAGGLAVLLRRDPMDRGKWWKEKGPESGVNEIVNDLNRSLTNFWQVLQDPTLFAAFERKVSVMPFSQREWEGAATNQVPRIERDVDAAVAFFVRCRQSRAGACESFAPISRTRTRCKMNEQASAWLNCIDGLHDAAARIRSVVILNEEATKIIEEFDDPRTLFYLDPPYVHDTRMSKTVYMHEMSDEDHRNLLRVILQCKGKVMLSGYENTLYDERLVGWRREVIKIPNHAAGGKKKRVMEEVLWMNFHGDNS